jgi:hypothetical protein
MEAYSAILKATHSAGITEAQIKTQILDLITVQTSPNGFVLSVLKNHLI